MVARRAHNPKVTGSSPVPATKTKAANWLLFLCLCGSEACFGKSIGIKKQPGASRLLFSSFSPPPQARRPSGANPVHSLFCEDASARWRVKPRHSRYEEKSSRLAALYMFQNESLKNLLIPIHSASDEFLGLCVAPEFFNAVETAFFLLEYMHHHIDIVQQHPLRLGGTFAV